MKNVCIRCFYGKTFTSKLELKQKISLGKIFELKSDKKFVEERKWKQDKESRKIWERNINLGKSEREKK